MPHDQSHHFQAILPLAVADQIITAALKAGRDAGLMPLTVAVLDAGGTLVALKREDGSALLRPQIAIGKAWGALGLGLSSRSIRDRMGERLAFLNAAAVAAEGRLVPVPGGVLALADDGAISGAVGISGDASDKDEYCAIVGIRAAGLRSEPAEPIATWRDAVP